MGSKTQGSAFWREVDIQLMPHEEILYRGTPDVEKITTARLIHWTAASVAFMFVSLLLLPLVWWLARMGANRHQYFVTNQRVIVTDGLIGYRTRSVPLERISDVQVNCTWIERTAGIRSVVIRDMTGEAQGGATMQGLTDPSEVQSLILQEVARVNATVMSTVAPASEPTPAVSTDSEVVTLLREIRDALVARG